MIPDAIYSWWHNDDTHIRVQVLDKATWTAGPQQQLEMCYGESGTIHYYGDLVVS